MHAPEICCSISEGISLKYSFVGKYIDIYTCFTHICIYTCYIAFLLKMALKYTGKITSENVRLKALVLVWIFQVPENVGPGSI